MTTQALRGAALFVLLLATVAACGGGDGRESGTPAVAASRPAGWSLVAPMSQRRSYFASAGLGGSVYVAGGMVGNSGRHLDAFARYDIGRDR